MLTTVAIMFGVITKLLLGGQSNGLFYRFSFINLALIFIVVLEFFNAKFEFIQKEANYMKLYSILFYSYIFVYLLVFVWWCVACFTKYLDGLKAFPIAEGFMVMTLVLFAVMLVGVAITILIYKKGLVGKKYLNIFASVALGITLISNIVSIGTGLGDKTTFNNLQYHTTMLDNNSKIKIYNSNFIDKNVNSLNLGVKTGSFFYSLVSNETVQSYKTLGYSISSVHADSWLGNIVSDSLMGYRYVLAYEEMNRPYLKLVSMEEDFYVYENTLATTGAVFLPEGFEYNANASVFENLTALKNAFGIEGELVKDVVISSEEIIEFDQNFASFITKYTYTSNADQILYINKNVITLQREGNEEFNAYFDNLLKSENIYYIESFVDAGSIRDLMFVEAGKTVEFYVCNVETGLINEAVEFKTIDYNVAKNICESLQARSAKINYTKDGYEVSFVEGQTGKLLVLCPDIAGMNYKLNDSSIDAIHEFGYFSVFEIADSTSKITATYRFAEGKWWIVVTFLMIALIVLVSVLYKKTQFKFMEKATQIGFYVANCCILVVFFLFGIILTIFRSLL